MADRGRDLKVSILSDADRFDLAKPADDLDRLGDSAREAGGDLGRLEGDARQAGADLDRLGRDAKGAEGDVDRLGRSADATARDVRSAFNRIEDSGRKVGQGVQDGTRQAERGLDEFRDEADSTAKEAAASFDGSAESVGDAFQEVAANAFAGFGPAGAAAGLAAAVGIGFAISAIEGFKERSEEAKAELAELTGQMIADGGRLRSESVLARLEQIVTEGTLDDLSEKLQMLGVDVSDVARAMAGNASDVDRMVEVLERYRGALPEGPEGFERAKAIDEVNGRLREQREDLLAAEEAARLYAEASGHSVETYEAVAEAMDGFTDSADAYQEALREKAEAEQTSVESTRLTTQEYLAQLEEQVAAQESWAANLSALAARGVQEGVLAELARMGPEGAPLVAELTTATDEELGRLQALMGRQTQSGVDQVTGAISRGKAPVSARAAEMAAGIAEGIRSQGPAAERAAQEVHRRVQDALGPVTVRVRVDDSGLAQYRQGDRYLE